MVVWVFAGGGISEMQGLVPFLRDNFDLCTFERKTPFRKKPGPKPGKQKSWSSLGRTGISLAEQIKSELAIALKSGASDLILVVDDLDCNDPTARKKLFADAVDNVPGADNIEKHVGFAAPEIESWLIADWKHTFANDVDFRSRHENMRWWLIKNGVTFHDPESFSTLDPAKSTCKEKLSDLIIQSSLLEENKARYSKGLHTPRLLMNIDPDIVCGKCRHFKDFYLTLKNLCNDLEKHH